MGSRSSCSAASPTRNSSPARNAAPKASGWTSRLLLTQAHRDRRTSRNRDCWDWPLLARRPSPRIATKTRYTVGCLGLEAGSAGQDLQDPFQDRDHDPLRVTGTGKVHLDLLGEE